MTALDAGTSEYRLRVASRYGSQLAKWLCLAVVLAAVILALVGPILAPHDPIQTSIVNAFGRSTASAPLGLDSQGRDIVSRLLAGARTALVGPLLVVLISMTSGSFVAVLAAWVGGWVDSTVSTVVDLMLGFPAIVLAVLAAAVFGPGVVGPTLALAVAYTPFFIRVLRSSLIRERARDYIIISQTQGQSSLAVCVKHLLPNVMPMIFAQATLMFGYAMIDFAALSYLGLGVQPPRPDWGSMVQSGQRGILLGHPSEALSAGLCIVVVVVAVNFLGERLSEWNQR